MPLHVADRVAGLLLATNYREVQQDLGSFTGAKTLDIDNGNVAIGTATGAVTWTFSNPAPSGQASAITLILTNGGAGAQTWPASVDWAGGTAPTLVAAGVDVLVFVTRDGGTTWYGNLSIADAS